MSASSTCLEGPCARWRLLTTAALLLGAACAPPQGAASAPDAQVHTDEPPPSEQTPPTLDTCHPSVGARCAGCGVVGCAFDAPICVRQSPCEPFEEVLALPWPEGHGFDEWGSGLAFGDIDADSHVDAVVGGPDGLRVLFGDGTGGFEIREAFEDPGPDHIAGVVLVDFDGDGDLDLFATCQPPTSALALFENDGLGRFSDVTDDAGLPEVITPGGAAWADFDGDGDLDAFVPAYFEEPSLLLENDGQGGFTDIAAQHGIDDPVAASLQGLWFDYDDDGDQDLFVANDKGPLTGIPSALFRNDGPEGFLDVRHQAGLIELVDGMGVAPGDFDGDGDFDLYVTDIGYQDGGQLLYVNQGDGTFVQRSRALGLGADQVYGWSAAFLDLDNDRDLDLVMAGTDPGWPYIGEYTGRDFLEVGYLYASLPQVAQVGLAAADFDADGRLDIGFWLLDPPEFGSGRMLSLLRNISSNPGHWLRVALHDDSANPFAIGAVVSIEAGGERQRRLITAGEGFFSSSEPIAHFGLGDLDVLTAIEVRWPDGHKVRYTGDIPVDRLLTIER